MQSIKAFPECPAYSQEIISKLVCKSLTTQCWQNNCNGLVNSYSGIIEEENPSWNLWTENDDVIEEGSTDDLLNYIISITPQFVAHLYIKTEEKYYKQECEEVYQESAHYNPSKALLQDDFSENFTCIWQDEVQSAHWNHPQVSLFTAAPWHSGSLHAIVLVSDN